MRNSTTRRARGFSLIEIIITLVVLGIAAAMLATFMGQGVSRSSDPVWALQNDASLQAVMENMIAASGSNDLAAMKSDIGASGADHTNDFGTYHVDRNSYCDLDTGTNTFTDSGSATQYLCVTIAAPGQSGSKISYLFTE